LVGYEPGVGSRVKNDEQLDQSTRKFALGLANQQAGLMGGPPQASKILKLANSGAISALSGTIFETAVSSLLSSKDFDSRSEISTFDFVGSGANSKLKKLFPQLGAATQIEAKIRPSPDNKKSMFDKVLKATGNAAGGYIPNFAGGALDEAVAREQAAGLPINQIRINQSGKLRNSQNPQGLAVTNTRDEPTGAIPNFAAGGRSTPATPGGSSDGFNGGILAASTGLFFLSSAFSNAESGIGKFISEIAFAASALTSLTLLKGPVENIGAKLSNFGLDLATKPKGGKVAGGLGRGIAGVGGALPGIGAAVAIGAVVAPLVLELTKTKTGFERLNEELKNIDLGELSSGSKEASAALKSAFVADIKAAQNQAELKGKLGFEADKEISIEKILEKQVKGLTGINRGAFGGVKDKETLSASLAKVGDKNALQSIITASQKDVTKVFENPVRGTTRTTVSKQFDAELFAQNMIKAIDLIDAAAAKAAEGAAKVTREANFGKGAVTGGKAKKDFEKNIDQGRFAAGGFDKKTRTPGKGLLPDGSFDIGESVIEAGLLSKIRSDEFALAKAITTESKVALENQINLDKNSIEAAKARFSITKEYVKSIEASSVFRADELETIQKLVAEGKDLNQIEQELLALGTKLNVTEQESFKLALAKLELKNRELESQEEEIKNQNEINNLNKPQGFSAGISKGLGSLDNDIAFFRDELGENIPLKFSDNLGSAMQEAVSGAKDLDDALSDAGRNFLGFIRDAFLQQAASQLTSGLFGGGGDGQKTSGLLSGAVDGVKGFFNKGEASGAASAAGGAEAKSGGVGGFLSGIFGGGGGGGVLGSTPSNPMFVKEVGNMKLGLGQEGADKAAGGVAEQLTGEGGGSEGIFSKLKSTLMESFGNLKTTFGDLFGGLKEGLGGIFGKLTGSLGSLFSNLGGGGGGGGIGGIANMVLGAFGFGFATGGPVGFANGGSVGSTDTVPAMLTPGEFVVKKSSVDKYGTDFLSNLNRGMLPMQGFQNGGTVSPVSSESGTGGAGAGQINNNSDFTFNIQDGKVNQEGGQSSTQDQQEFATRVRSAVTTVIQEESRSGGSLNYLYKK